MEEKYIPNKINLDAGTHIVPMIFENQAFVMDDEFYSKVVIYIEISGIKDLFYTIRPKIHRNAELIEESHKNKSARIIQDQETLYKNRDSLGKVTIYYEQRVIKEFPNFKEFLEAIER